MFPRLLRSTLPLAALLLLAATGAAAAPLQSGVAAPRFLALPNHVLQGAIVNATVAAGNGSRCALVVRYADGRHQPGLTARIVAADQTHWAWQVPANAHAGAAQVSARCAGLTISRTLIVVGNLAPPKIEAIKRGFSVRPRTSGSDVSYGLVLHNVSTTVDALRVDVLVNFVLADGHLIGSARTEIPELPAGVTFDDGGQLHFPGAAPVARLEVVIQSGGAQRHDPHQPAIDNVVFWPSQFEPAWLGEIDGEIVNNQPALTLTNTQLYAVVFDANGNVLGGTTGSSWGALPPGTRQVFKLTNGLNAIPADQVVTVAVSALGTFNQPGA